ncbi:Hypothetical predicted protein [Olea europaea subsp. europaea]|uniref:Uncharacterized protein n=1 Tax=Olea europaea subsp. europaea TaxID=158383 RepID=A0A8S0TGY9_OLEEU|nr:Hypothetical predicted protein [Olea europaea subsp. europaea]
MCAHFESDKFLKRSEAMNLNRSTLLYNHHGGTKSFTASREALSTNEELVGYIELFRRMHSTSKGWDNQLPESQYKEMVELQQSQLELEDEASIMDEAEICAQALG